MTENIVKVQVMLFLHPPPTMMGGCFCRRRYVGMFVNNVLAQFKSHCHQTSSVIPLATGENVIRFWKVKVGGGGMRSTERPSGLFIYLSLQIHCLSFYMVTVLQTQCPNYSVLA